MAEDFEPMAADDFGEEIEDQYATEDKVGDEQKLTPDGGVIKKIITLGEGWEKPEKGDKVEVHYVGTLLDGTKFDSSRDRGDPFTFTIGQGQVIKGWDLGVASMKKGEKALLTCAADYAYGESGSPPKIPGGATLQFEVELLSWKSVKDISGDGGVIKTIIEEGSGWQTPGDNDEVVVNFTVRTACAGDADPPAQVLTQSADGGDTFAVRAAPCKGFTVALKSMKLNEKVVLKLKPEYTEGIPGAPADANLEAELQLLELHKVEQLRPGLELKSLNSPEGWKRPNEGAVVTLHLTGRLLGNGEVFVARGLDDPLVFTVDEEQVPEGLELAVLKLKEGERALVTASDASYAYGEAGWPDAPLAPVPGGSGVVWEVELVSMTRAKEKWEMSVAEKIEAAKVRKEKGNAAYKAGKLERAVTQYEAAAEMCNGLNEREFSAPTPATHDDMEAEGGDSSAQGEDLKAVSKQLKLSAWLNLAAAELKRKGWAAAAKNCDKVLELDPQNVKALYRRAQALIGTTDLVEAERDLRAAIDLEPANSDLLALQRRLKVLIREQNKKEAGMYGRMFKALGRTGKPAATPAGAAAGEAAMDVDAPVVTTAVEAAPAEVAAA